MLGFSIGNQSIEIFLLMTALMMLFSVLSSKASTFIGVPSLLLFLGIGMLAGSEGPGGVDFSSYPLAFIIGSISLVFILFDGGMRTPVEKVRPILRTGISLSTLGVLFTCLIIGVFCHYYLNLPVLDALLLGAIISSTDAAAVFSVLRSKSLALRGSLKPALEFEAGSNDPTAIFLTMAFLTLLTSYDSNYLTFLTLFFSQAVVGLSLGWAGGRGIVWLFNKIKVDYDGLYPVLLVSLIILVFSVSTVLQGSGFLAVYIAGIIVGNSSIIRKQSLLLFQDGVAWIAQIALFLVLGLLVFPTHLLEVWKEGVALALFMMFVARPLSVFLAAPMAKFNTKERVFISWVGLRGAAPIILAILPWSVNYPNAEYFFNIVFFVVLFSILIQGPSIPWLAKKLGITEPMEKESSQNLTLLPRGFVTIELKVKAGSSAEGARTVDLQIPSGVLLISLEREGRFIVPRGDTQFEINDKISALGRTTNLEKLTEIFGFGRIAN